MEGEFIVWILSDKENENNIENHERSVISKRRKA